MPFLRSGLLASAGVVLSPLAPVVAPAPAAAQAAPRQSWRLPAQPLAASLRTVALRTRRSVAAPADLLNGRVAPAVEGDLSADAVVDALLQGSGLRQRAIGDAIVIEQDEPEGKDEPAPEDVVVTGSRVRGAPAASPAIVLRREAARDAGQTTVADVVRSLPQNFGGGQNPGIGFNVPEASGADIGGGTSVNLRGLGADATLTLLNGRRLPYTGPVQSIDISAIPFGLIDRIEVVPDGASALFGSDAVAGVVNVVLRRGFSGLETSGRLSTTTEGGGDAEQLGVTAGRQWRSGGLAGAYEYLRNGPIVSDQRDYARSRPGLTLYPALRRHSAAVTGRQTLAPGLTFAVDALLNRRRTELGYPLNDAGDLSVSRALSFTRSRSFTVAPSLTLDLPSSWQVSLAGSLGRDRVDYRADLFFDGERFDAGKGYYRNRSRMAELSGDGSLFALPGGPAKLALGVGYRRYAFERVAGSVAADADRAQDSWFAFGEFNLPVIAPAQDLALVHRLNFSLAGRYERYPGIDSVFTPKLGLVYAPSADVELKGSWGRSFRAPTLYQQYQPQGAYLATAASLGGAGLPPGSTALLLLGGDPDLQPERSTNWSATLGYTPRWLPGLSLEASWFNVRYTDRIVTPILFTAAALRDPAYAQFVTFAPSAADQAAILVGSATFVNLTGGAAYDPARVTAVVRNTSVNAGRQTVRGLDLLARYRTTVGRDSLGVSLNASYLDSEQRITPAQPVTALAGRLFNPPHWRARGEMSWTTGPLTFTGAANYIGPVRDTRAAVARRVDGMLPVDLTARFRSEDAPPWMRGLDVIVSAQNLFNDEPDPIATTLFLDAPYDSTNYSPFGRVVTVSVVKSW
jgi:outer membrane receptor protein involved in Fe transport